MKALNHRFNLKENILLLILSLILLSLLYYYFVDQPVRRDIAAAKADTDTLQVELTAAQQKLSALNAMQNELSEEKNAGYMLSYNGIKSEMTLLNTVMNEAEDYSLNFEDVTREGNQVRRNFTAQFTAKSYEVALDMLKKITSGEYRCIIDSVSVSDTSSNETTEGYYVNGKYVVTNVTGETEKSNGIASGSVEVTCNATFYETMVEGKEDAGLPQETGETESTDSDE